MAVLPKLIVLSAPSGAGKTTLCELLLKEFSTIALSISTTTRTRRDYEKEGIHYFFVSPETFQKKIDAGEFAEWAQVHSNRYGTSKAMIGGLFAQGKHVLFDIDVQGAMSLKKLYPDRCVLIFIHPPSMQILEERLRARASDSAASIEKRLQNAYNEVAWSQSFQYEIVNDDLQKAYKTLREIVKKECP